ncbi:hypothetical protein EDC96DRAFT_527813 [Choanephora cucurbitarum]|nr:hypothetical protein EDC96DRAFT_527813 [Choanephora cucurbitarum]
MTEKAESYKDKLLLIFVHGFRGTDTSFKDFPNRLRTDLSNTIKADVSTLVYPSYKTAGELKLAVNNFSSWLCEQVAQIRKEQKISQGSIMIALLGHSMGGIVSAETILRFHANEDNCQEKLLGAKIIGMLAFDTPFYSISHNFVANRAISGIDQVRGLGNFWNTGAATVTAATATATRAMNSTNSNSGKKWGLLAGVVGAAAIGAAAYLARDQIQETITDAYDQLTFISDLTDMHGCDQRVRKLIVIPNLFFKCFYVQLYQNDQNGNPRTFINLPPEDLLYLFVPVLSPANNEIDAHTSMFNPIKTDRYYELASDSMFLISEMVARHQRS